MQPQLSSTTPEEKLTRLKQIINNLDKQNENVVPMKNMQNIQILEKLNNIKNSQTHTQQRLNEINRAIIALSNVAIAKKNEYEKLNNKIDELFNSQKQTKKTFGFLARFFLKCFLALLFVMIIFMLLNE